VWIDRNVTPPVTFYRGYVRAVLAFAYDESFGHFIGEVAPVVYFAFSKLPEKTSIVLPVGGALTAVSAELYLLVGCASSLIYLEEDEFVVAEQMYVVVPHYPVIANPDALAAFRVVLWKALNITERRRQAQGRFLNREPEKFRHIANGPELYELLREVLGGLEWRYDVSKCGSIVEQFEDMRDVYCVTSPEGSHLGRLVTMPADGVLYMVMHGCNAQPKWFTVTRGLELYYVQIIVREMLHSDRELWRERCPVLLVEAKRQQTVVDRCLFMQGLEAVKEYVGARGQKK
jgi:hypothetical protein